MSLRSVAAWAFAGIVASVAMTGPLLFDEVCYTKAWENHPVKHLYHKASAKSYILGIGFVGGNVPCIGHFFWQVVLGSFLLGYFLAVKGRFDPADRVHTWTRRFLTLTMMACFFLSMKPWILAACPKRPLDVSAWWALCTLCFSITVCLSQACLMQIAVLRLCFVAETVVVNRARRLVIVTTVSWIIIGMLVVLSQAVGEFKLISSIAIASTLPLYVSFHIHGSVIFGFAALAAAQESRAQGSRELEGEASLALATAVMQFAAACTWVFMLTGEALLDDTAFMRWIFEFGAPVNGCSDVGLALLCAGLIGKWHTCPESRLSEIGNLVRERQIRKRLVEAATASTGPALMLAALIESQDADRLMFEAIQRFRCVSWDVLANRPDIMISGGPLNVVGVAGLDLYKLSKRCQISDCDAFVSHSWHDNGSQKWDTLKAWCEHFERKENRWPQLWLDKVCIDQQNIEADLKCLPIFLAGCEKMLVLAGSTYTSRLWCCVELFTYMQMIVDDPSRQEPIIKTLGADNAEIEQVRAAWLTFDAAKCSCFKPEDKTRMLKIFDSYPGGLAEFNRQIKVMAPGQPVRTANIVCL